MDGYESGGMSGKSGSMSGKRMNGGMSGMSYVNGGMSGMSGDMNGFEKFVVTRWRLESGFGFARNRQGAEAFLHARVAGGVPTIGQALWLRAVRDTSRTDGGLRAVERQEEVAAPPGLPQWSDERVIDKFEMMMMKMEMMMTSAGGHNSKKRR